MSLDDLIERAQFGRSSSARYDSKLVLVEGSRAIAGAKNSGAKIRHILAIEPGELQTEFPGMEIIQIDVKSAKSIATTTNPQGVMAICEMPIFDPLTISSGEQFEKPVIVLDNVCDPGNVGTIIQSATVLVLTAVILVGGCDPFHPKVVRSSAGMIFGCPVSSIEPFQLEEILKGRQIYKAQASDSSELQTIDFPNNPAIAFGNEANGFQTEFFRNNTLEVSINMEELCESLNVAMTATIIAYHLSTLKN